MINPLENVKIARVSTVPFFILAHLRSQLEIVNAAGADITVVASEDEKSDAINQLHYCKFKPIYIAREISLIADVITLFQLVKLFKTEQFDIVHSSTPKAGLLCALAAKLSKIPVRLHTFTGQPWVTMEGIKKSIVKFCDKIINSLNTHNYVDSFSQREFLIENKVVTPEKITVLGSGSFGGVNLEKFNAKKFSDADRKQTKETLGINHDALILLFVGRVTRDKGIFELIEAFSLLETNNSRLLIVGPFELGLEQEIRNLAKHLCGDRIIFTGFCAEPERMMAVSDILCLPSYREGFGTVVIEAAAMSIPTIGTRIYGLTDAIVDGATGWLIQPKNVLQLKEAMQQLITDAPLRQSMGQNAYTRAVNEFDSKKCGALLVNEYKRLLNNRLNSRT
ncbi:MAG: glycosyltransferase family 4 protein [Legionella sp.]|nr:glycosyltransferase family 4 protein [Legionella sp.]